jgi:hypothetical protein
MTSTSRGSSGPSRPGRSLTSRTSLLTAAAIAGVLLAGTAAVAANIGILNAADNSAIGDLAATDELLPTPSAADTTLTTDAPSESSTAVTTPRAGAPQQYDISGAGTVWVMTTTSGVALDHVVAEPGWNAALAQGDPVSLQVNFTNGARTIVFTASAGTDGTVVVDVTEPSTVIAPGPAVGAAPSPVAVAPTTSSGHDDDFEDDGEHEDDDDHEYEGADDDD